MVNSLARSSTSMLLMLLSMVAIQLSATEPVAKLSSESVFQREEPLIKTDKKKLPSGTSIKIDNPYGNVYLRFGGYEHLFEWRATIQQPAQASQFIFKPKRKGDQFFIDVQLPKDQTLAKEQRIDLVVYIPQKHKVIVATDFGSIESRGVNSDMALSTTTGSIRARGTVGMLSAQTDSGDIDIQLKEPLSAHSEHRFMSKTGNISIGVNDNIIADVLMKTSGDLTSDYSLTIEHHDTEEPGKHARASVGSSKDRDNLLANVMIESKRGNLKLWRRAVFVQTGAVDANGDDQEP